MNKEEIFRIITGHVREVIPELKDHDFQHDDSLKNLGANSIDRSEIVIMTLESLSLRIPLIEMAGAENMGELATILHEKLQAR
jgi:polyketide biosynthesis acyl carrier protein